MSIYILYCNNFTIETPLHSNFYPIPHGYGPTLSWADFVMDRVLYNPFICVTLSVSEDYVRLLKGRNTKTVVPFDFGKER